MNGLCRREIFHNKSCLLALTIVNLLYFGIHLLPSEIFDDVLWRVEVVYFILWGILLPIILYGRYGDSNRRIIMNVVYTKLRKQQIYMYQFLYFLWLIIGVATVGVVTQLLCVFSFGDQGQRGWFFIGNALLVTIIYILLFLVMLFLTQKYLWAVVLYLVAYIGLILFRAPESILWFIYDEENFMHGISGKIILIFILFMSVIFIKIFSIVKNYKYQGYVN